MALVLVVVALAAAIAAFKYRDQIRGWFGGGQ